MRIRGFVIVLSCSILFGCRANTAELPLSGLEAQIRSDSALKSFFAPAAALQQSSQELPLKLSLDPKSVRFAVIGDSGTGESPQFEIARKMEAYRQMVNFSFVIMLGDNIYGGDRPQDFARKFEQPYKPLLDAGVKFYASLGNHDNPDERQHKPFNMSEDRYYTFKKNDVSFFVLDSTYMSPEQLSWLEGQLRNSNSAWKICYFR